MKMHRMFTMVFMMVCLVFAGMLFSPDTVYAKKITSMRQAEKAALKEVKNGIITEVDKDYKNGKIVYEIHLVKGTREYEITYRASDGKMISYEWEEMYANRYSNKKIISKSKCKQLAKKKVKNATITSLVKKHDDGIVVYKVKMKTSSKKYELEYHARTGKLLEYKWELITSKSNNKYIGINKAKSIALAKVPGAIVIKAEFDKDNGVPVYEVELIKGDYEYEIKIHAKTGKILEIEKEYMDDYYDDSYDDHYYY